MGVLHRYIVLFNYSPTRNGSNVVSFWGDYPGYLVCDGYDGYNKLEKFIRCGCRAHIRCKFDETLPTNKVFVSTSASCEGCESHK